MRSQEEPRGPTITQVIGLLRDYRAFLDSGGRHISEPPTFARRLYRMREALGISGLLDTVRGSGSAPSGEAKELIKQMEVVVSAYDLLRELAQQEKQVTVK